MIAALALALSLAPCPSQDGRPVGQTLEDGRLVDHDYAFALEAPRGWTVMDEDSVATMSPDAVAALTGLRGNLAGTFLFIIVEPLPAALTLGEFADLCCQGLPSGFERLSRGEVEFQGVSAERTVHEGSLDGLSYRFEHTFFLREGFGYQIVAGGTPRDGLERHFEEARGGFELLPDAPRQRIVDLQTPDQRGIDWEVQDGVYRNAPLAVRAAPPEGWRLIVGHELALMSGESLLGLVRADEGVYMLLDAYRIRDVEPEAYVTGLHEDIWNNVGVEDPRAVADRPAGRRTEVGASAELGMTYAIETWVDGDVVFEATAWTLGEDTSLASEMLFACDAIERLSAEERAALVARLDAAPADGGAPFDVSAASPATSYWGRTLRRFDLGVVLRIPAPPRWHVSIGDAAVEIHGEGTIAALHSRDLGVWVKVEAQTLEDPDATLEDMHDFAVEWEADGHDELEFGVEEAVPMAGRDALTSDFSYADNGGRGRARLWTLVDPEGVRAIWVTARGYEGNVARATPDLAALVRGIELRDAPMARARRDDGAWIDEAFGFSLDTTRAPLDAAVEPPSIADITPEVMRAQASLLVVDLGAGAECVVMAVAVPDNAGADEFLHEIMARVQPKGLIDRLFGGDAPVEPVPFAGQAGTRRRTGSERKGTDILVTTRGGFAFGLIAIGKLDDRERMARWFELSGLPQIR